MGMSSVKVPNNFYFIISPIYIVPSKEGKGGPWTYNLGQGIQGEADGEQVCNPPHSPALRHQGPTTGWG